MTTKELFMAAVIALATISVCIIGMLGAREINRRTLGVSSISDRVEALEARVQVLEGK